jgi:hypothetical protein
VRATLIAIAILLAPYAAADPRSRERAAVVAIDLGSGTPTYLSANATSEIEAGLTAAGYEVVTAAEVEARLIGELARCREGACVRRVGEALGMRSLVFVTIDARDENTAVTMRLHDGRTGEREAVVNEVCDLCGQAELSVRLVAAAAALRARSREARARKAKQTASARTVPVPPSRAGTRAGASRSIAPGILLGAAGAIAVGGGLYLMTIDGSGTCDRGDQPVYPAPGAVIRYPDPSNLDSFVCRDRYETRTLGIASTGIGVVAIAAGVALVVRARQGDRAVEIVPRPGGASIGVSWSW